MLAETELPIEGDGCDFEQAKKDVYSKITESVMRKMGESDLKISDVTFACQIAINPLSTVMDNLQAAIEMSCKMANDKLWGKENSQQNINFTDIDRVLKS